MNEDQKHEAYHRGFEAGKEHELPSPETKQFIVKMEQEINYIKEKLDKMPTREEMLLCNEKLVERIFVKANEKYAPRLVGNIVYGMVGIIVVYVLNQWLDIL